MAVWCPRCGAEYVEGWGTCSNCGVELVDTLPAIAGRPVNPEAMTVPDPEAPPDEDPFVPIWEGPTAEAHRLVGLIERAHIPVDLGDANEPGRARIEVPLSYVDEARDALAAEPTEIETIARPAFDWTPAVRLALVVVVATLILMMVFTLIPG